LREGGIIRVNCFAAAVTSAELMNGINESTGHYNVRGGVPSVQKRRTQFYANVKSSMVTFPGKYVGERSHVSIRVGASESVIRGGTRCHTCMP
jgi:hypothetical protein